MFSLTSLGGAGTVTGSKHLLHLNGDYILIDCGLFQGAKQLRNLNWAAFPIEPRNIAAVVLTHAHLDHSGYLPRLVRDGFRGRILATAATRDVAELILKDSGFLQEKDAEYANRKGFSKHSPALPLYTVEDAERALERFSVVPFDTEVPLHDKATLTFRHAGHILGAATADIAWGGKRIVFSGDIGRYDDALMPDPQAVPAADYVVVESTYGDRVHAPGDPTERLGAIIEKTVARGGTVVVPAFAVGRAQSLLYHIWQLKRAGRLSSIPIYLDSPMAISASDLFCDNPTDHRLPSASCRALCEVATYARDVAESKAISASRFPKVVVAASGMASGGRVLHHLKTFAPDHRNTILFAGYQADGTRGRRMLQGEPQLTIHGEWVPVRAEVQEISSLSAHADSNELMRWLGGFRDAPSRVFVVHGERHAAEALRERIHTRMGWSAVVSQRDEVFDL